ARSGKEPTDLIASCHSLPTSCCATKGFYPTRQGGPFLAKISNFHACPGARVAGVWHRLHPPPKLLWLSRFELYTTGRPSTMFATSRSRVINVAFLAFAAGVASIAGAQELDPRLNDFDIAPLVRFATPAEAEARRGTMVK